MLFCAYKACEASEETQCNQNEFDVYCFFLHSFEVGDVEKEKASELVQEDSEVPIVIERVPGKAAAPARISEGSNNVSMAVLDKAMGSFANLEIIKKLEDSSDEEPDRFDEFSESYRNENTVSTMCCEKCLM